RPRPGIRQQHMPDFVGVFWQLNAFDLALALSIEKTQLDLGRMSGEQREVDPKASPGRATGIRRTLFEAAAEHDLGPRQPSVRIQVSPVVRSPSGPTHGGIFGSIVDMSLGSSAVSRHGRNFTLRRALNEGITSRCSVSLLITH